MCMESPGPAEEDWECRGGGLSQGPPVTAPADFLHLAMAVMRDPFGILGVR